MPARPALAAALPLALALAGCAASTEGSTDRNARVPAAKVVGEAQSCIPRSQVRQSQVRSDSVIDFEMRGGKVYRVTMPTRCPGLGFERAFAFETSIDQMCGADIIYVLMNVGGVPQRGAGCGLAPFVPIEYEKRAKPAA
ncbi:MAG: hypothetical protein ACJLS3_14340 [Erythrobacter sp.]